MRKFISTSSAAAFLLGCLVFGLITAQAQEKKADPTGTWTWSFTGANGNTIAQTLKLKLQGDKLTGVMVGRNGRETAIESAKLVGNEISFQVNRERDGQKMTSSYKGILSGDTIKGNIESNFGGQTRKRSWEAKKETK